jgi:hypothetical protein
LENSSSDWPNLAGARQSRLYVVAAIADSSRLLTRSRLPHRNEGKGDGGKL